MPDSTDPATVLTGRSRPVQRAVRLIALFEALKGCIVMLTATGLLALVHRDVHALAVKLVEHAHLNPASHYPHVFIDAAADLKDSRLLWLAAGAATYGVLRVIEAYGLLHERAWAEVLAAGSGAIYVPFELAGLMRHATGIGVALLLANLVVVAVMLDALRRRSARRPRSTTPQRHV